MNFKTRLDDWLGKVAPAQKRSPFLENYEQARSLKHAERYPEAVAMFAACLELAGANKEGVAASAQAVETLALAEHYDDAQDILSMLLSSKSGVALSHAQWTAGWMAQLRADLTTARTWYEKAQQTAETIGADMAYARAACGVADTYLADGNASYAIYTLRKHVLTLAGISELEYYSYYSGRLGQALIASGQVIEGTNVITQALNVAEENGFRRYVRMWSVVLGERYAEQGFFSESADKLEHALRLAPEHATPERQRIYALLAKTRLALREFSAAHDHAQRALHDAESLGDPMLIAHAHLLNGQTSQALGNAAHAVGHLQIAADAGIANARRLLAGALVANGALDPAITIYHALVGQAKESTLEMAQTRRDLGLALVSKGDYSAALTQWGLAMPIFEKLNQYAQVARLYCEMGNVRKTLSQHTRALKDFEHALMTLNNIEAHDLETRGIVLACAAAAYAEQGDVESADAFFNDALLFAVRTGDKRAEAIRNNNYGYFLLNVGRPRRACALLERAIALSKANGHALQVAIHTDNLGLAHDMLSEHPAALRYHTAALELIAPLENPRWHASIAINTALTHLALKETDAARSTLEIALRVLSHPFATPNEDLRARAAYTQALLALKTDDLPTANAQAVQAVELARRADQRVIVADALAIHSQVIAQGGDLAAAKTLWQEAAKIYGVLHMPQAKISPSWLGA
jgi:tetratricopeptide (TPR) repeat protein